MARVDPLIDLQWETGDKSPQRTFQTLPNYNPYKYQSRIQDLWPIFPLCGTVHVNFQTHLALRPTQPEVAAGNRPHLAGSLDTNDPAPQSTKAAYSKDVLIFLRREMPPGIETSPLKISSKRSVFQPPLDAHHH
jgi:hypothetical protein